MNKQLQDYKDIEFSLDELVNTARQLLEGTVLHPLDGRIAPVADVRTVRHYQTVGIMRKPLRYDGRNAVYGYVHLLQLLAIKLLQRQGLSLAQIQNVLIQATLSDLEVNLKAIFMSGEAEKSETEDQPVFPILYRPITMNEIQDQIPVGFAQQRIFEEESNHQEPRKLEKTLFAEEVIPGLTVLIDPTKIQDPQGVLARISKFMSEENGDKK